MQIGKKRAFGVVRSSYEVADTTRAAQVDSAREPKRSDPIPAISPTLSPTLSAIVPGLVISSSLRSLMTLPTRSAPTSAALVQIPPPTLPKRATEEPPRPYPATSSKSLLVRTQALCFQLQNCQLNSFTQASWSALVQTYPFKYMAEPQTDVQCSELW